MSGNSWAANHCVQNCFSVPPINVKAKVVGSTWIALSWEQVPTSTVVVNQTVIISGRGATHNVTVDGSQSSVNVTELTSGVTYTLQVVAVAEDGQLSFPSVPVTSMTLFPCEWLNSPLREKLHEKQIIILSLQFLLVHQWTSRWIVLESHGWYSCGFRFLVR